MSQPSFENFTSVKRTQYLQETSESLEAFLNDALVGADQNEIKTEFPDACKLSDIKIESKKVSLVYHEGQPEGQIEVVIEISFNNEFLGEYNSVYDLNGNLIDELFYFE